VRGLIDFPFPVGIGPNWCSGILQSYSHVQRPRDRWSDVERPPHERPEHRRARSFTRTV